MATSTVEKVEDDSMFVDKLPEEINEMKIRDDKVEKVAPWCLSALYFYIFCLMLVWCISIAIFT